MNLATVYTRASIGIEAPLITIEVHISNGLPAFTLVGLPETTVKEAKDRVRSAIINSGFLFPSKRITVNLAPAELPKQGSRFDLPIAIGILAASEQIHTEKLPQHEFIGELALSGELRPIQGIISASLAASHNQHILIFAQENAQEVSLLPTVTHLAATSLLEICHYLCGHKQLSIPTFKPSTTVAEDEIDLSDIIGQEQSKRALEIAAAGKHSLLLLGPPGTGKTMLAQRIINLLPPMTNDESIESAVIYSLNTTQIFTWNKRPFRAPHHSITTAALIGGGANPKPGEISLAHNGVLFLDELPEFERRALESLRQPLEQREVIISRASAKIRFPANIQLIAAMNPSPTGHYPDNTSNLLIQQTWKYLNRLSGPLIDRFDLSVDVPALPKGLLSNTKTHTEKMNILVRERIFQARQIQIRRCGKPNAELSQQEIKKWCHLKPEYAKFLENTLDTLGLSVRAWHKIIKVARTIADLANQEEIQKAHLAEAIGYRYIDRFINKIKQSMH